MSTDIKPNVKDGLINLYVPAVSDKKTQKCELIHNYKQIHFFLKNLVLSLPIYKGADFIEYGTIGKDMIYYYVRLYDNMFSRRCECIASSGSLIELFMAVDILGIKYDRPFEVSYNDKMILSKYDIRLIKEFCRDRGIKYKFVPERRVNKIYGPVGRHCIFDKTGMN